VIPSQIRNQIIHPAVMKAALGPERLIFLLYDPIVVLKAAF
jgi:hypothetical protein